MSLATTCPQCRTSFKVVPDQLKLRRGQVRCGVCQHVFSGLDSLRYVQADNGAATTKTADTATMSDATRASDTAAATGTPSAPRPSEDNAPAGAGATGASEPIAIRSETSASIDEEAQPRADPFIDIESITSQDSPEPRNAAEEPTLEALPVPADAPADSCTETARDRDAAPSSAAPFAESATASTNEPTAAPTIEPAAAPTIEPAATSTIEPAAVLTTEPDTQVPPDRDTETLAARDREEPAAGDTLVRTKLDLTPVDAPLARDTIPLQDAGSAFDTLARDLGGTGPRAAQPELTKPAEDRSGDATTDDATVVHATTAERGLQAAHARPAESPSDDETDAVDFFSTQRSARGFSTRGTLLSAFASIVLAALLAAQAAIGARDWLAAHYPALRPAIAAAIGPLGLEIAAPRALDSLTIEGFELQSAPVAGLYSLNALLRNGADHEVRWPAMELTLNDQAGNVVVRKVLMPADYLPGASVRSATGPAPANVAGTGAAAAPPAAIAPAVEISLRAALEASGVEPTGYTVKLFYP